MDGDGGLLLRGKIRVGLVRHEAELANPVSLVLPAENAAVVHAFGGLSKLEAAAAAIVGPLLGPTPAEGHSVERIVQAAREATRVAYTLLDACQEAQARAAPSQAQG